MPKFELLRSGEENTTSYVAYFKNSETGELVSPWHDVPLEAAEHNGNRTFNFICEIPRWTNAKMEIATGKELNPIVQDTKKGKLRYVHNVFPHHGYIWNYGALPQTWENPKHKDEHTGCMGDGDPLDCCDISTRVAKSGEVYRVKVLGLLAMIDDGETDWKVFVVDVNDPDADKLNDLEDIEKVKPGLIDWTRDWFRRYKMPAGKPENTFAFEGKPKNKAFALSIIDQTRDEWKAAFEKGDVDGSWAVTAERSKEIQGGLSPFVAAPSPLPGSVDDWVYTA